MIRIVFSPRATNANAPAVFIDRDGVINCKRANDYVLEWRQFVFVPGIRQALRDLSTLRLPMIVISNQAAVGKGLLQPLVLGEISARLNRTLLSDGVSLNACYYCPHRIEECCDCRKPRSGMLRQAAADFAIDLARSIFIGDSETDVQAAQSAGCRPILFGPDVISDLQTQEWAEHVPVARTAKDLFEVAETCLQLT